MGKATMVTRGTRFEHTRQRVTLPGVRAADSPLMVCTVTRVTATTVYFRNATGFLSSLPADSFAGSVARVLPDDAQVTPAGAYIDPGRSE